MRNRLIAISSHDFTRLKERWNETVFLPPHCGLLDDVRAAATEFRAQPHATMHSGKPSPLAALERHPHTKA